MSVRTRSRSIALLVASSLVLAAAASVTATDERRSQMWWFDRIGVEAAWGTSQGAGIVIAVLDTGIDPTHPDLVDRLAPGRDLVDRDDDPSDPNGHGTIVAGLAAATANNDEGIAGVAPLATLLPVRVLAADGRGASATVDQGIRWAVDNGADIVNLSLEVEESADGTGPDPELIAPGAAIEYAWEHGVIVVAATGNSGAGAAGYGLDSHVVLVGAVDRGDLLATFSDADRLDAVMAPGVDMVSTWCDQDDLGVCREDKRYGIGSGTSFAAPVVAGVLALLRGAGLDHEQAVRVLRDTAEDLGEPGPDQTFGVGIVDAAAALATVGDTLATAEEPTTVPSAAPTTTPTTAPTSAPTTAPTTAPDTGDTLAEGPGGVADDGGAGGLLPIASLLVVLAALATTIEARASRVAAAGEAAAVPSWPNS